MTILTFVRTSLILSLSAFLAGGAAAQTSPAPEGSTLELVDLPVPEDYYPGLKRILEQAGRQAPELVRVGLDREIARENLKVARSRHYPSVGVGGNVGYRFVQRSGEDDDSSLSASVSAGISRPLYFWGAVSAGVEKGEIDFETSLLRTRERFQETVQSLREEYLRLILNEMRLRNLRLRRNNLETQMARKESDYRAGRLSEEEYLDFQIELDRSLIEISELEDERNQLISSFRRISGVETIPEIPGGIAPIDLDALEAELRGEENPGPDWVDRTFNVQLNRNTMEKIDRDAIIIRSRQRPNISFSASVSQAPVNTATANDVDSIRWFAGLSVSWNVFDGFATQASRRINLLEKRRLESRMRSNEQLLDEQRIEIHSELLSMIRKQRLAERRFDLDSRIYSRVKGEYSEGRVSTNQFRQTQSDFYVKEYNLHLSRFLLLRTITDYLVTLNADRSTDYLEFGETDV
ncbi:MAG: TolC family protein [Puniceicoccaceae bacterium]